MANEELIYRITRAVYQRLGTAANEQIVENLVTDIYRVIETTIEVNGSGATTTAAAGTEQLPLANSSSSSSSSNNNATTPREQQAQTEGSAHRLVVSVFGVDRPGIVAAVAQVLAEAECSIVDINQTVVGGKFAMVLISDTSRAHQSAATLKERFRREGDRLGVRIYAQREDLFNAMHRI